MKSKLKETKPKDTTTTKPKYTPLKPKPKDAVRKQKPKDATLKPKLKAKQMHVTSTRC
eukprot:TRINITY_DN1467_c0_g1_i1.p6 TRINITY_DN1467_c0_g1~~TRINITY_DN1467_c0_g1_i1.p6  ORF type:complete len:58 (-),score=14.67 TRINITY_DN1467_c0_g1_i1:711-884(-)